MARFLLPDLGEGLEEAQLVQWLVAEGDTVALNQPLCQVETAKAMVDIPSPYAGVVERLHAQPGDTVSVGAPLITIREAQEARASQRPTGGSASEGDGRGPVLVGYGIEGPAQTLLRRRRTPRGGGQPFAHSPAPEPVGMRAESPAAGAAKEVAASPLVRKMAAEQGIDLTTIQGTGPGGRIRVEDLQAARQSGSAPAAPGEPAAGKAGVAAPALPADEPGDERISTVGLRKAIAARMVRSATTIPQFVEYGLFDATTLAALRERLRGEPSYQGVRLSFLPFFVRALVEALRDYRIMNSRWDEEGNAIVVKRAVHVGIATDTERGLLVPVIRHAETLSLAEIAKEADRLAATARAGRLDAQSLSGSTITITNVGASGPVETGAPLINPPEACVVGFGAIKPRPTVVGDQVLVRPGAWISISCDHRIVDGATGAGFLAALVRHLEAPEGLA
jgi:2-oxoisovalerate dehydrogenase E2 component (dihydrolipoyl transacylase)